MGEREREEQRAAWALERRTEREALQVLLCCIDSTLPARVHVDGVCGRNFLLVGPRVEPSPCIHVCRSAVCWLRSFACIGVHATDMPTYVCRWCKGCVTISCDGARCTG